MESKELTCSKQFVWCDFQKIVYDCLYSNLIFQFFLCVCEMGIVLRISLSYNISNIISINSDIISQQLYRLYYN